MSVPIAEDFGAIARGLIEIEREQREALVGSPPSRGGPDRLVEVEDAPEICIEFGEPVEYTWDRIHRAMRHKPGLVVVGARGADAPAPRVPIAEDFAAIARGLKSLESGDRGGDGNDEELWEAILRGIL